MKIGILTLPVHINYGGILQAYALQTVLERMGHNVCILSKQKKFCLPWYSKLIKFPVRAIQKFIGLRKVPIYSEKAEQLTKALARQNTQRFVNRHMHIRPFYSLNEIKQDEVDCIVVGSDQIWRARYFKNVSPKPSDMFLAFTCGWPIKRIAYAASLGTDTWELDDENTSECAAYAQKFDAVSVREDSGVELCRTHLGVQSELVLDPTMLLTRDDYKRLIDDSQTNRYPIASYLLDMDDGKMDVAAGFADRHGEIYALNRSEIPVPAVEFWLNGFLNADRMITDSFHGTAFSINLNIPFVVLSNPRRGQSRLESILRMFHLEDRMVTSPQQALEVMNRPIDWGKVNNILTYQRQKSLDFLSAAL